jgi:hypothetical protein
MISSSSSHREVATCRSGVLTTVVGGGLRRVLGSVLHNDGCIRSMPIHKNEEELTWSDGSSKRGGWSPV